MAYLEELLPEFRKGVKIRCSDWIDGFHIQKDGQAVIDHNNRTFHIHAEDTLSDQWELYKEPEPDWGYIIKNKRICWFWCGIGKIKYLNYLQVKEEHTFRDELGSCWDNCRPVRRDEVTFYEDKKND